MPRPFPANACYQVDSTTADAWLEAARSFEREDPSAHHDPLFQQLSREVLRSASPEGFDRLVEAIEVRLSRPPFAILVRGIHWDANYGIGVGLGAALGLLVSSRYRESGTPVVHGVPQTPGVHPLAGDRFHNDGLPKAEIPSLLAMICVEPDRDGEGRTQLLSKDQIREEIRARGGVEALDWFERTELPWRIVDSAEAEFDTEDQDPLRAHLEWKANGLAPDGVRYRRVFEGDRVHWRRDAIDAGFRTTETTPSDETRHYLDLMERTLAESAQPYDHLLQPGDLFIADNQRCLHRRTPLRADSRQRLLRTWIEREARS